MSPQNALNSLLVISFSLFVGGPNAKCRAAAVLHCQLTRHKKISQTIWLVLCDQKQYQGVFTSQFYVKRISAAKEEQTCSACLIVLGFSCVWCGGR